MRLILAPLALVAAPALAQEAPTGPPQGPPGPGETVFDDTWATFAVGAGYSPSYSGSDDYRVSVLPVVQGKVAATGHDSSTVGLVSALAERRQG